MHCEVFLVDQGSHGQQIEQSHDIIVSALVILV